MKSNSLILLSAKVVAVVPESESTELLTSADLPLNGIIALMTSHFLDFGKLDEIVRWRVEVSKELPSTIKITELGFEEIISRIHDDRHHGHAHRDTKGHLLENDSLRTISHITGNFYFAIHRARMHHNGIMFG